MCSQINLNKTKVQNRLQKESLEGILYTKDFLKLNHCNPDLVKMLNSNIYL